MVDRHLALSGLAAVILAAIFLLADRLRPSRWLPLDDRSVAAFTAGMAIAYVFVGMMPDLAAARGSFAAGAGAHLPHEALSVYFVALLGFVVYYGLERRRQTGEGPGQADLALAHARLHLCGIAAYAAVISYLLVRSLEDTETHLFKYTFAMGAHFLTIAHGLEEAHGEMFQIWGRYVLAASVAIGWLAGAVAPMARNHLALVVAFVLGAVTLTSAMGELENARRARFAWFAAGGLAYGLILVTLG
jgi:hypothetical protein